MMKLPKIFRKKTIVKVPRPMVLDPKREPYEGSLLGDLKERWAHRGERITVEFYQKRMKVGDREDNYYSRDDRWTQVPKAELHQLGFLPGVRVPGYDSIQWWRQPVYVRVQNYQQFDIHAKDDEGRYIYSQDTPSTLNDEMTSNATREFIKAMFKTTLPTMDVQKLIMIGILAVGAVFGLMMMGVI